jgi:hypothetical protein
MGPGIWIVGGGGPGGPAGTRTISGGREPIESSFIPRRSAPSEPPPNGAPSNGSCPGSVMRQRMSA